jgi:hypothetical protein
LTYAGGRRQIAERPKANRREDRNDLLGEIVKEESNPLLSAREVDRLVTVVEESTRATADSPQRFIEPARGTLDRAKSRRHHLIFGRRGSGKTSLLKKAQADLTVSRTPVAFIDLEAFKGHAYPDVLLSILVETLQSFDHWLGSAAVIPASRTSFWKRLWGSAPARPPLKRAQVDTVREAVSSQIRSLRELLHSEDATPIKRRVEYSNEQRGAESHGLELGFDKGAKAAFTTGHEAELSSRRTTEDVEDTRRDKVEYLHRHIIDFQRLFSQIIELSGSDAYVFLDDLYHIPRKHQPHVLDYFHRIAKGRGLWLKVGTIRHRTDWYRHGDPPIGMKLGDDADDIDLDITLEKYTLARDFLLRILDRLCTEAECPAPRVLLADGGMERLVLASGGVARDFLTIFRRAVDVARERGLTYRGGRINAEDVNVAAGEHDSAKRDELKRDTAEERAQLERALLVIQQFCIQNLVNCFLVRRDDDSAGMSLLGELVDLRFVHVVESRTTVRERKGELYTAYMLDISQYTGARSRRKMSIIEFWKRAELDRIRRAKYALDADALLGVSGEQPSFM